MSDELCSLFDGLNPGYKLPDFVSPISQYAQLAFNNLVQGGSNIYNKVKTAITGSGATQTASKTGLNPGSGTGCWHRRLRRCWRKQVILYNSRICLKS